jgi:hypothetical protein
MAENEYIFLPYLRRGLSRMITKDSFEQNRATVKVTMDVVRKAITEEKLDTIERNFALYGPQDVVGINTNMITKVFPANE